MQEENKEPVDQTPMTAEQLAADTGMSMGELIENCSINDGASESNVEKIEQSEMHCTVPYTTDVIDVIKKKASTPTVDYPASLLKGADFIEYVTQFGYAIEMHYGLDANGMEINVAPDYESYAQPLKAYMETQKPLVCSMLMVYSAQLLLYAKGTPVESLPYHGVPTEFLARFKEENKALVDTWMGFVDSFLIIGPTMIKVLNEHYRPDRHFPVIDDENAVGVNALTLMNVPSFTVAYFQDDRNEYNISFYPKQFFDKEVGGFSATGWYRSKNNHLVSYFESHALGHLWLSELDFGIFRKGVFSPDYPVGFYDKGEPA